MFLKVVLAWLLELCYKNQAFPSVSILTKVREWLKEDVEGEETSQEIMLLQKEPVRKTAEGGNFKED